jgi:putative flippase GtrA
LKGRHSPRDLEARPGLIARLAKAVPVSLIRYGIVGAALNGLFYGLGLFLVHLGWEAWLIILVLNPIAVMVGFLAHRHFSFASSSPVVTRAALPRYIFVYVVAYIGGTGFAYCLERLGVASWLALLLTIGGSAVALYMALNLWVFRERGERKTEAFSPGPVSAG